MDYDKTINKLQNICESYSDILGLVILFGSFSRKEAKEGSDIDLYIEPRSIDITTSKLWKNRRYNDFQKCLFENFPQEFDFLAYGGKRDIATIRKTPLWQQIESDGVTIYDQRSEVV